MKRADPIVLSAPSGTGKTTLARRLIEESDNCVFSLSITTRTPRQGEQHGLDYLFVDGDRFDQMINRVTSPNGLTFMVAGMVPRRKP